MKVNKKKLALNIVFYLVLAFIYAVAILALFIKANNGTFYVFNKRVDIVLTDSMSERNANHADYLSDTTQIKPFDMIVSEGIKEDTEIKEKDCVIFKNPKMNNKVVVHRVIGVYEEGILFKVDNARKETLNNEEVFSLETSEGRVTMESLDYRSITLTAYSHVLDSVYFVILEGKNPVATTCETTKISDDLYKHTISYTRESTIPYKTFISSGTEHDVYLSNIVYDSESQGVLTFSGSELTLDASNNYQKRFNSYYLYEIRADKSSTADGFFLRENIDAKVTRIIPKLGHVFHFLQSIPGIIMLVGLTIIITLASFFWTKGTPKKVEGEIKEVDSSTAIDVPVEEKKKPKTTKKKPKKKEKEGPNE